MTETTEKKPVAGISPAAPVSGKERYVILDALRGLALLGICLANLPEFSLYTFMSHETAAAMPSAGIDSVTRFLQLLLVDGKFYTIFSLLFGIGFSIIISHAAQRGADGFRIFYRRMALLAVIGLLHMFFIWAGDILMLYAFMGMLLPLFRNLSDRGLLTAAAVLLLIPIAVDGACELAGISLSAPVTDLQWRISGKYGITQENFGTWLRDAETYREMLQFQAQGCFVRMQEFIDGNRYFKVLGLFIIGFWLGRNRIYADLEGNRAFLKKTAAYGLAVGLPLSLLYAWSGFNGHPWGNTAHTVIYTFSVYPLAFAYVALICLIWLRHKDLKFWNIVAAPGRMALTNYIGQSVIGVILFYGIAFGLGTSVGLAATECIAVCIFLFQIGFSLLWLRFFRFGPLEWVWRMLTYGKYLEMRNK